MNFSFSKKPCIEKCNSASRYSPSYVGRLNMCVFPTISYWSLIKISLLITYKISRQRPSAIGAPVWFTNIRIAHLLYYRVSHQIYKLRSYLHLIKTSPYLAWSLVYSTSTTLTPHRPIHNSLTLHWLLPYRTIHTTSYGGLSRGCYIPSAIYNDLHHTNQRQQTRHFEIFDDKQTSATAYPQEKSHKISMARRNSRIYTFFRISKRDKPIK